MFDCSLLYCLQPFFSHSFDFYLPTLTTLMTGFYHLFYQYNPCGSTWGNMVWGHMISTDMVQWQHLPVALKRDAEYDILGIFTGSTTMIPNPDIKTPGQEEEEQEELVPRILYTGVTHLSPDLIQHQCLAFPSNLSDPHLVEWTKYKTNPLISVPNGRDPTTVFELEGEEGKEKENGETGKTYHMLLGAMTGPHGDMTHFTTTDPELTSFSLSPTPFYTNKFSSNEQLWECPDFFSVLNDDTGKDVFVAKISSMEDRRDHWEIGHVVLNSETDVKFKPLSNLTDISVNNDLVDGGLIYASKTFLDTSPSLTSPRRVLFGWVTEGDDASHFDKRGYSGTMSLPRIVTVGQRGGRPVVLFNPVPEVEQLRESTRHFSLSQTSLEKDVNLEVDAADVDGAQMELLVSFDISGLSPPSSASPVVSENVEFGVRVLCSSDRSEETVVKVAGYVNGSWALVVNTTIASLDNPVESKYQVISSSLSSPFLSASSPNEVNLRIFVDHSLVEVYAQDGEIVTTARAYPAAMSTLTSVFSSTPSVSVSTVDVWAMKSAWEKNTVWDINENGAMCDGPSNSFNDGRLFLLCLFVVVVVGVDSYF